MLRLRILITKKYILKKLSRIRPSCGLIFFSVCSLINRQKGSLFLRSLLPTYPHAVFSLSLAFSPRPLLHKRDYYVFGVIEKERKIKRVMFLETQSVKLGVTTDGRRTFFSTSHVKRSLYNVDVIQNNPGNSI